MSYASENKRANPASMALAIGVNGSIILAVALSPVVVEQIQRTPFTGVSVPIEPLPPPPEPETQKPDIDTQPLQPVFAPDPIVDPIISEPPPIRTGSEETTGITVADGKGGGEIRIQDPPPPDPPAPIFRSASRDPRFARDFQPDYPPGLLQKEIEGTASIRVLVGTDGRVRDAQVVSASHPDFGKAAVKQALRFWRFRPATRGEVPVEDWQTLNVRFTIH